MNRTSVRVRIEGTMQYIQTAHRKQRTISSQGGSIWCMAANPASTLLALGCEDGTVRLLALTNDTLSHFRRFDRVKCRLLSIAWGPPTPRPPTKRGSTTGTHSSSEDEDEDKDWVDTWLVTGGSDSSVRKWDVSTGGVVDRMGTDKLRGERTLVWTVGVIGSVTRMFSYQSQNFIIEISVMEQLSRETRWEWSNFGTLAHVPSCRAFKHTTQMSFA